MRLTCVWEDDKIFRGVDGNGDTLPKTPLPNITFHITVLEKNKLVEVDNPPFKTEVKFFSISRVSDKEAFIQGCVKPYKMKKEEYANWTKNIHKSLGKNSPSYEDYLEEKTGHCSIYENRGFLINRFDGNLKVPQWFNIKPSLLFDGVHDPETFTEEQIYYRYKCVKEQKLF